MARGVPVSRLTCCANARCPNAWRSCFSWTLIVVFCSIALALISFFPKVSQSLCAFFLNPLYLDIASLRLIKMDSSDSLNAVEIPVRCISRQIFFVLALVPSRFRSRRSHISISPLAFLMLSEKGTAPILSFRHFFAACLREHESKCAIFSYSWQC